MDSNEGTGRDAPRIYASLTVSGDIDQGVITEAVGVNPTHTGVKGRMRRVEAPPIRETYWMWQMDKIASYDGTLVLTKVVDQLEPRADALDRLRIDHGATITVRLNAAIEYERQSAPYVFLDKPPVARFARLGVNIEFDFMLLASD
jgi:hypothetical protein